MCGCIKDIDGKLAPEHTLNTTMSFRGEPSRAIIGLIRKDAWKPETRRNKPTSFLASFCPFCGEKYAEGSTAKSSEEQPVGSERSDEGHAPRDTLNTNLPHESKSPDHG